VASSEPVNTPPPGRVLPGESGRETPAQMEERFDENALI